LVLVAAPTWLFAGPSGDRSIRYQLRSVSPRDECSDTDLPLTMGEQSLAPYSATRKEDGQQSKGGERLSRHAIILLLLPLCFPGIETTRPPFGGPSEVIEVPRKSGAGEGIRTLDPDLGKVVVVLFQLGAKAH
jgi:hypothetical protein